MSEWAKGVETAVRREQATLRAALTDGDFNRRMKLIRIVAKAYGDPNAPGFDDIEHEERVSHIVECLMKEDN